MQCSTFFPNTIICLRNLHKRLLIKSPNWLQPKGCKVNPRRRLGCPMRPLIASSPMVLQFLTFRLILQSSARSRCCAGPLFMCCCPYYYRRRCWMYLEWSGEEDEHKGDSDYEETVSIDWLQQRKSKLPYHSVFEWQRWNLYTVTRASSNGCQRVGTPELGSRLSTYLSTKLSKWQCSQHASADQAPIASVSFASPGLKPKGRVWRADAPRLELQNQ